MLASRFQDFQEVGRVASCLMWHTWMERKRSTFDKQKPSLQI